MARNMQLIYDVGLHQGEDTEFYLKKGYRVIAFEANPGLVEFCRDRFAQEIHARQLHIVEGAIAPPAGTGRVKFYLNRQTSVWGTIDTAWAARNAARGADSTEIEVDRINMTRIFEKFGMPFYLKIDIEGADGLVLDALRDFEDRPQFVSLEANTVDIGALAHDLETLIELGYKQFQLVPQQGIQDTRVDTATPEGKRIQHVFRHGASGVFGEELTGVWIDRDAVIGSFAPPFNEWQDIHAKLSESEQINVALNRPATQSSVSAWSTDQNPEVDARIANNGDVISQTWFHTAVENDPWWQVDLGELFFIEKIIIYNRNDQRDRLKRFTVLGSSDGDSWKTMTEKADDNTFSVFAADVFEPDPARFVRVRLDGRNCLHFRECQIFGRRA